MTKRIKTTANRIGNSGADSNKLNICNSIGNLYKCWAPPPWVYRLLFTPPPAFLTSSEPHQ
jgi:hypothetical protein